MDFSKYVYKEEIDSIPSERIKNTRELNGNFTLPYLDNPRLFITPDGWVSIPFHEGYFFNLNNNTVISKKKGRKYLADYMYLKIYTENKTGLRFVNILRSSDNCRHKYYLIDIQNDIIRAIRSFCIPAPGIVRY